MLLCDPRHGLTELDDILLEVIRPRVEQGLKFLVLLTKADKLNRSDGAKALSIARLQAGGGEVKLFSALKSRAWRKRPSAVAVGAPEDARPRTDGRSIAMIETFAARPAPWHHAELPRRGRARPARADVPARLSRGGLRLGCLAGTFRPAGARRLPLPGAQPARLRKIERAGRRQGLPGATAGAGHRRADRRSKAAAASRPGGARLGRRGGWNLANQLPHLTKKLAIINSPHPGTFLRELQDNPTQQAASAYMNFLIRPDAEGSWPRTTTARLWPSSRKLGRGALADRRASRTSTARSGMPA